MKASDIDDIYPLSPMQEGMLFQSLLDTDSEAYHIQYMCKLHGKLEPSVFLNSWQELTRRHAVLRSAFVHEDLDRPVQVVLKERSPESGSADISALSARDQDERIDLYCREDLNRGFDLARNTLMRVRIFRTGPESWQFVWSYPHILLDGWCLGVLYGDLMTIYRALSDGRTPNLAPVVPYKEYISWLKSQDRDAAARYWQSYLSGASVGAGVPGREKANGPYIPGERQELLGRELSRRIKALAAGSGVTLNTLFQAGWGTILARYSNTDDVVFGTIVSGRPPELTGIEEMVGLFINAVPCRVKLEEGEPFAGLLKRVQESAVAGQRFHYLPLADIQGVVEHGRDLVNNLLIFENYPFGAGASDDGAGGPAQIAVESGKAHDVTHYDFALIIIPGNDLGVRVTYNRAVFSELQIARTVGHLRHLLEEVVEDSGRPAQSISVMSDGELNIVTRTFNQTEAEFDDSLTVLDLIRRRVADAPDAPALVFGESVLSYAELNRRAMQMACFLTEKLGVARGSPIGVLMERSDRLVTSILGILNAGCHYVPMEPTWPPARVESIIGDAGIHVLLTQRSLLHASWADCGCRCICMDEENTERGSVPDTCVSPSPDDPAYVIYTSGSTGRPKGCLIEHRQLFHYLTWANDYYYKGDEGGCFGLYSPLSFDLTVTSLFLPLIRGKALHVFPHSMELMEILDRTLRPGGVIDSLKLTPSHISLVAELGLNRTDVNLAIVGGEALTMEHVRTLTDLNPNMAVYNEYGPTETTVGCVVKRVSVNDDRTLIGRPISNTGIYILDSGLNAVPLGVSGEIFIGGSGVARGYVGRPELNGERFISDPYGHYDRLYRSGDTGRWTEDGELDYLGRNDDQVKVRGHRIEPGEIEGVLSAHPAVKEAVVVPREDEGAGLVLAAYAVLDTPLWSGASEPADTSVLGAYLADRLPSYMVPAYIVALKEMPLTPNGKLDRRALPDPCKTERQGCVPDPPIGEMQTKLKEIWERVLGTADIGVHDDFFALGGHSLKAMQVVSRMHKELQLKVSLLDFFSAATIARLAALLEETSSAGVVLIPRIPESDFYLASHAQRRLWLLQRLGGEQASIAYNMPRALLFKRDIDAKLLTQAFEVLVERHEALRTGFAEMDGEPVQKVFPASGFVLHEDDFTGCDDPENAAREICERCANTAFELENPPLIRARLIKLRYREYVVLLVMNHIIGDGWSMTVLYREVMLLYDAFLNNRPHNLKALPVQYKDYSAWQLQQDLQEHREYWLERLSGLPAGIDLPYDYATNTRGDYGGNTEGIAIDVGTMNAVRELTVGRGVTLSSLVLSVFNLLLFQLTRQEDLCVGMSIAGRNHPDTENLIGFFVNVLPVRTHVSADMEFDDLLAAVSASSLQALAHADYPFDLIVQDLNPGRDIGHQPVVNVVYGFQSFADVNLEVERPGMMSHSGSSTADDGSIVPFDIAFKTAKFDLTLFATDDGETLRLDLEYDSGLFSSDSIRRYLRMLRQFIAAVAG